MRKTTLTLGQLLCSVHMKKSYLGKAGYLVLYNSNPPLEVAPEQRKTHVNSYRRQTMHRGTVDPGVSELPQGNELSWDHVNRPSDDLVEEVSCDRPRGRARRRVHVTEDEEDLEARIERTVKRPGT